MFIVSRLETPNIPSDWGVFPAGGVMPGRYVTIEYAWDHFLWEVGLVGSQHGIALYEEGQTLLAYSFEREGWPSGDIFDRNRVRVTCAMPLKFKLKLIEEVKSGKRHMRKSR